MKRKRCPNLHYYDGDKYDRCPHCAAAKQEPAPELKPVMEASPADPPKGCKFHTRCRYCTARCKEEVPVQKEVEPGHFVVCHRF